VQNGAANITVSNSATVTGNSALLRVLDPQSPTIVNFNASWVPTSDLLRSKAIST
jgi:hypothetical protein